MKIFSYFTLMIIVAGIFLSGCDNGKNPVDNRAAEKIASASSGNLAKTTQIPIDITLAGFQVHYDGRIVGSNSTKFKYKVTGPAVNMHFRLELPACAPAFSSVYPSNGTTSNTDPYINPGVEWHPSTGATSYNFSITYPGSVPEGIVLVSVKSGSTVEVGQLPGACARVFDISGTVFTDANNNGQIDASETKINNATVNLLKSGNNIAAATTNSNGFYIFEAVPAGNYTVKVDETTVVSTSNKYLEATTPTSIAVSIGPNASGKNFGFAPKTSQLINDLKKGTLPSSGKAAKYWQKELKAAITGKGKADYSKAALRAFITQIRALLLSEPFQLPGGDGLQAAFDILDKPVKTDLDKLRRELLAAEFNHVAGFGILNTDAALQLVLLGWGESLVQSNSGSSVAGLSKGAPNTAAGTAATLSEAIGVFSALNSSGGGSGGGGPR